MTSHRKNCEHDTVSQVGRKSRCHFNRSVCSSFTYCSLTGMFIMAMHGLERRTDTTMLSIRQLLPTSTGRREGHNRQAQETVVHSKTPSCIEAALLRICNTRGTGLGCHTTGSAEPWTLKIASRHAVCLWDTMSWVFQCLCWHHEPLGSNTGTQHWKASLHEHKWALSFLSHTHAASQLIQGKAQQQEQELVSPLRSNHGILFFSSVYRNLHSLQSNLLCTQSQKNTTTSFQSVCTDSSPKATPRG